MNFYSNCQVLGRIFEEILGVLKNVSNDFNNEIRSEFPFVLFLEMI